MIEIEHYVHVVDRFVHDSTLAIVATLRVLHPRQYQVVSPPLLRFFVSLRDTLCVIFVEDLMHYFESIFSVDDTQTQSYVLRLPNVSTPLSVDSLLVRFSRKCP